MCVFDPGDVSLQLIDISAQLSSDLKFAGAAPATIGMIILVPDAADSVGVFDPDDESLQLIDISEQLISGFKLACASPAAAGKLIFAPRLCR